MNQNTKVWAIIPARGGSKGIPGKNIAGVSGRPLIAHTIDQAFASGAVDDVFVSTDDPEIARVAFIEGANVVMRPDDISSDYSPSEEALLHVLDTVRDKPLPDVVVMLQCTSPIREPQDIDRAVAMLDDYDSVLSATRVHKFLWREGRDTAYALNYDPVYGMRPMRQELDKEFYENGSIYATWTVNLRMTGKRLSGRIGIYEMPYWSQFEIDEPRDLELVEWIMENQSE